MNQEGSSGGVTSVTWCTLKGLKRFVASSGEDGTVIVWNISDKKIRKQIPSVNGGVVSEVDWSRDGSRAVSVGLNSDLVVWDMSGKSPKLVKPVIKHSTATDGSGLISSVSVSNDGKRIISGGLDGVVKEWSEGTTHPNCTIEPQDDKKPPYVTSVRFSPDNKSFVIGWYDGYVDIYQLADENCTLKRHFLHGAIVEDIAWRPNGKEIATVGEGATVFIWNIDNLDETSEPERELFHGDDGVKSVAWSPDGKTIASGGIDGTIKLWDISEPPPVLSWWNKMLGTGKQQPDQTLAHGNIDTEDNEWASSGIRDMEWSPDGKQLTSGGSDGNVKVWDID